jgi:succinate dehydrogenase hydrophobic anchor subunit
MSWRAELSKNWRARASAVALVLAIIVLIDEVVKEGYTLDPYDFVSPGITHEKIFLALVLLAIILGVRWRRGG